MNVGRIAREVNRQIVSIKKAHHGISLKGCDICHDAKDKKKKLELFKNSDGDLFNNHSLEWTPSFRLKATNGGQNEVS